MSHGPTAYCNTPPNYVGSNHYCEWPTNDEHNGLYSHSALFAGKRFCVELPEPTNEPFEFRICSDQGIDNEDALLEFAELYVQ